MKRKEAIEIIENEAVQKFPTKVTCADYSEAKRMVIGLAKCSTSIDLDDNEDGWLEFKYGDSKMYIEFGVVKGVPQFSYVEVDGESWRSKKEWECD